MAAHDIHIRMYLNIGEAEYPQGNSLSNVDYERNTSPRLEQSGESSPSLGRRELDNDFPPREPRNSDAIYRGDQLICLSERKNSRDNVGPNWSCNRSLFDDEFNCRIDEDIRHPYESVCFYSINDGLAKPQHCLGISLKGNLEVDDLRLSFNQFPYNFRKL